MKRLLLVLCLLSLANHVCADTLSNVLARMDKAATGFHAMSAKVVMATYEAVLSDTTTDTGTLQMQRLSPKDTRAIFSFQGSDGRTLAFAGRRVRIYYPKLNSYQDYDLGHNSNVLNQYLLLGFGSSGTELAQSYQITVEGTPTVEGQQTVELKLIPKDPAVLEHLSSIEMWIPQNEAYPIQQQFFQPNQNWRKVTYSDIQLNPRIEGKLEFKLPPGAKQQH